jgi:Zn-dependent alcohol dehydrogenase
VPFDKFIKIYRLEDINQAIDDQNTGKTVKAVLLTDVAAL